MEEGEGEEEGRRLGEEGGRRMRGEAAAKSSRGEIGNREESIV